MKIIQGNCFDEIKNLPKNSVNLVFTSPPYANMKKYDGFDGIEPDKYVEWLFPLIKDIFEVLTEDGSFILNINDKVVNGFRKYLISAMPSEPERDTINGITILKFIVVKTVPTAYAVKIHPRMLRSVRW